MADERRIFPTETILALVAGKKDADTRELAAYLLGRPVADDLEARAAAPFASAWLARWQPKFMDLDWQEDGNWQQFVAKAKSRFGDHISVMPMSGQIKVLTDDVMDRLDKAHDSLLRQTDAAAKLEQRLKELEPLENAVQTLQKKNDELEARLKASKSEMAACQRKLNEYEGKVALDDDELRRTIKDAIADGLKGLAVSGGATTGTAEALAEAEAPITMEQDTPPEDEWGFKSKRKKNSDW